ncbi:hypothetical protein VSDG_04190 [Cytospora chrysosperma]|uniref:Cupin type-2 domain-containing protein n=1 Tax=Cytospora chrysosperma TaxID=252740 RepID=A0A423W193_CYTCH|nr:hypothetical protein VSDG_04190 [Valsa sordida]
MADNHQEEPLTLRTPNRFITDHDDATGLSVFNTSIPDPLPAANNGGAITSHLGYATTSHPADLTGRSDLTTYSSFLPSSSTTTSSPPPGIVIPGGSVLRIVDMRPGGETPMHRTVSLDYGVVLEGEVELVLDSGESRVLRRGDVSVQRGTSHAWRNRSRTGWGRMLFVTLGARPVEVNGEVLGEDVGGGL